MPSAPSRSTFAVMALRNPVRIGWVAIVVGVLLAWQAGATPAFAQNGSECADLSNDDFERAGETWMERMLGSAQSDEAMDRLMVSMMGSGGERQMHEYMGRRISGCGGGNLPSQFGQMMNGIGGMMAVMGAGTGSSGMMGGQGGAGGYGAGSMMGGYPVPRGAGDSDDDGPTAAAMVGMLAVLLVAGALAVFLLRPRGRSSGARETLDRRFASGELNTEQYRRAKSLLEGG